MRKPSPFYDRVAFEPMSGCWLWTGSVSDKGYGMLVRGHNYKKKGYKAHRVSWELHKGPIPKGKHVLHKCDVRCCVNPDHLFLGTHAENMADMAAKGRSRTGLKKLTPADVVEMRFLRKQNLKLREIGKRFGVSEAGACYAIKHIKLRKS